MGGRKRRTINVLGLVQVDAQDSAVGEREDQDVVGDLGGNKVGGDGELELDPFDDEHGQAAAAAAAVQVDDAVGSSKAVRCFQGHCCEITGSCLARAVIGWGLAADTG